MHHNPDTDPDWPDVAALQQGEDDALNRIMLRHQAPVFRFIRRMIPNASDAEELAQETFVRAYFQISTYRPQAPFVSWLYQIARNLCRDYFRSRAYKESLAAQSFESPHPVQLAENSPSKASEERVERLQAALLRLPVNLRESLILAAIEGLSHEEAGKRLGLSAKAVEVRCYRARKALQKILQNS